MKRHSYLTGFLFAALLALALPCEALKLTLTIPGLSQPIVLELPDGTAVNVESKTNSPPPITPELPSDAGADFKAKASTAASQFGARYDDLKKAGTFLYTCWLAGKTTRAGVIEAAAAIGTPEPANFTTLLPGSGDAKNELAAIVNAIQRYLAANSTLKIY